MNMFMPLLSEADPKLSAEGSIDPLGTYAIADALAVRLIPGVRERQTHPRFLTSIAVSLSLCREFDEDVIAVDGVSEPWQVFEWYLVEGMVRTQKDPSLLRGLPGQDKAASAIKDGVPLCEKRYLKTPTVFGFHGVYRALARDTEVERADRLGEAGYELVSVWEREQGLDGFTGTCDGHGKFIRGQLFDALRDGLNCGSVARKSGWAGWSFFSDHLGIYKTGRREARVISQVLLNPLSGFRKEVLDCLISPEGQTLWSSEQQAKSFSERRFHEVLATKSSEELRSLLEAISVYEHFCRLLQDAFDDTLFQLSQHQQGIRPAKLGDQASVKLAAQQVPELFCEVSERLSLFGDTVRFQESFSSLAERLPSTEWLERLLDHHCRIQYEKPPAGKAPWFDRFDDGSCMVRTGYLRDAGGKHDDRFVHAYRTYSLWSFAKDLKLVK